MPRLSFGLATTEDDPDLRRVLRQNPMPGRISVSFEREPNYFIVARVEGPFHQTIVARDQDTGEIIGMGNRAIRPVYLNGQVQDIGYLSQFRIVPGYRAMRRAIVQGWQLCQELHQDGRTPFYLSSIISDNSPARRFLEAGLPGLPCFTPYRQFHTLAIYCRRRSPPLIFPPMGGIKGGLPGLTLRQGRPEDIPAILACLQRNGQRFQFSPYWDETTLFNQIDTPGLRPQNFFLALDRTEVIGCLAYWDQNAFKQTVVRGYGGTLGRWRPWLNLAARLLGWPSLPPLNTPFHYCYASHLAVDDDQPAVFMALLRALYNHLVSQGYSYFMLGLSEDSPYLDLVRQNYRHIDYQSQLYLVTWEPERNGLSYVDGRIPGVEVAIL